jgi:hypothetical protein
MVETIDEFADELKDIRAEMRQKGAYADAKLVASWLDRLVAAMESITPMLGLMGEGLDQVAESEACSCECCSGMPAPKPAKKAAPKAKKAKKRK